MVLTFVCLTVFFFSLIGLVILLIGKWEKVTDLLNGIVDGAGSLVSKKPAAKKDSEIGVKSHTAAGEKTSDKKELPFWQQIQRVSPYKKSIALLLCLPGFLCIGGLQRLYVRSWFTGIVYLLTGGLFYIGTIVDISLIITNNFKDSNNLYLESEARKRWDSKYAKWRYVYWSIAVGRYFVDATSIAKSDECISCTYMVELNSCGKRSLKKMGISSAKYTLSYVNFKKSGSTVYVSADKFEALDSRGRVVHGEEVHTPFEAVEKDSMDECIYLALINS